MNSAQHIIPNESHLNTFREKLLVLYKAPMSNGMSLRLTIFNIYNSTYVFFWFL